MGTEWVKSAEALSAWDYHGDFSMNVLKIGLDVPTLTVSIITALQTSITFVQFCLFNVLKCPCSPLLCYHWPSWGTQWQQTACLSLSTCYHVFLAGLSYCNPLSFRPPPLTASHSLSITSYPHTKDSLRGETSSSWNRRHPEQCLPQRSPQQTCVKLMAACWAFATM
jgi:hypothetical protein